MPEAFGLSEIQEFNTPIDDLESETVVLVGLEIDKSGSMRKFAGDMKIALENFKKDQLNTKSADQTLIARNDFNSDLFLGGYKPIGDLNTDYDAGGGTFLYDAICASAKILTDYSTLLHNKGHIVKTAFCVLSDGRDETSNVHTRNDAKEAIKLLNDKEFYTLMICFDKPEESEAYDEGVELNFNKVLKIKEYDGHNLREALGQFSKSISTMRTSVAPVVTQQTEFWKD